MNLQLRRTGRSPKTPGAKNEAATGDEKPMAARLDRNVDAAFQAWAKSFGDGGMTSKAFGDELNRIGVPGKRGSKGVRYAIVRKDLKNTAKCRTCRVCRVPTPTHAHARVMNARGRGTPNPTHRALVAKSEPWSWSELLLASVEPPGLAPGRQSTRADEN